MGESARKFGETSLNEQSSRSHTIFRVSFESRSKSQSDKVVYSTLNLVDLAGSEGVSRAKTEGLRKREGANINKSLLALSNVISKLSSKESSFINYRDSKLTRLLQPCLGGNSRTVVICTINPLLSNYQETINTLKFAISAGAIKNQVNINERMMNEKCSLSKDQLREYNELKNEVTKSREVFDGLLMSHASKIEELERKIVELQEENEKTKVDFEQQREEALYYINDCNKKDEDIDRLKKDNQCLIDFVNEVENSTKKEFEEKAEDFQKTYTLLDRRLNELDQENMHLKNEIEKLSQENEDGERLRHEMKEEKERLIKQYEDQIEQLKLALQAVHNEHQKKMSIDKGKLSITSAHANNIITISDIEDTISREQLRRAEADFELKILEIETNLKSQLINKNKMIVEMNNQASEMTRELRRRDERIFDLENQIFFLKAQTPIKPIQLCKENRDPENIEETNKRRKVDNNIYVNQKVKKSTEKDEMRREIKYLESKNKTFERQLLKKKLYDEEYTKRLQDLTNSNLDIENMMNSNLSLFDRNF